jgi:hypothetical protein
MSPATIALVISLAEEAIKEFPAIKADFAAIFTKANPTAADWEALRSKVLSNSYADFVPASALPPG